MLSPRNMMMLLDLAVWRHGSIFGMECHGMLEAVDHAWFPKKSKEKWYL
jgi:hypothetical protein